MGWVWDVLVWLWPASLLVLIPIGVVAQTIYHWLFEPRYRRTHSLGTWYDVRDPERRPIDHTRPRAPRPEPKPVPKIWGIDDVNERSRHNQDRWSG